MLESLGSGIILAIRTFGCFVTGIVVWKIFGVIGIPMSNFECTLIIAVLWIAEPVVDYWKKEQK